MKGEGKNPAADAVFIAPLVPEDVERVSALAAGIWRTHYPGIISATQIEYMLAQRYDPRVMREELQRDDVWWDKLLAGNEIIGFSSYFLSGPCEMKLDKLYVRQDRQRRGYGGMLVEHACAVARERGCSWLVLAVNRNNANAISAYGKYGFKIRGAVVKDIGGGFVMDDYIMEKRLQPPMNADERR
ncbi:MAG: GNAT family N-acetyltransferase [Burkholderiales bacterium]|nr:GNAT family N-acetyltransferase [Burkholderiales bacterium]